MNDEKIKNEYKVEYYVSLEFFLAIGRVIRCGLFILMAFTNSNIILYIFALLLMVCSFDVVKSSSCDRQEIEYYVIIKKLRWENGVF